MGQTQPGYPGSRSTAYLTALQPRLDPGDLGGCSARTNLRLADQPSLCGSSLPAMAAAQLAGSQGNFKPGTRAGKMAPQIKVLAAKPGGLSSISGTHMPSLLLPGTGLSCVPRDDSYVAPCIV